MRLASRILGLMAVAAGPAVVALLGCGVDTEGHLPGLPNEIPNSPGGGVGTVSGQSSTSSSSSGAPVTAASPCDCAASLVVAGSACATCIGQSTACATQQTACTNTSTCTQAESCLTNCNGSSTCINGCIMDPTYEALLLCVCNACLTSCGQATAITCDITLDGGLSG